MNVTHSIILTILIFTPEAALIFPSPPTSARQSLGPGIATLLNDSYFELSEMHDERGTDEGTH